MADRGEFDGFVAARSQGLLRTAYLLTGDWGLAEDLLQTALAKSWFAWRRIEGPPEGYVRRTIVNTYATWWRRKWRAERPTGELPERAAPDQTQGVDARESMWQALAGLPRQQRAVIVLRYYEDMSEAEIAATLGVSAGTVKSSAARALASLRRNPDLAAAPPAPTRKPDRDGNAAFDHTAGGVR
ncbi:MAG TPA: SigE family RNA polymerase sigma factor [Mycobacteriales bacterium]|nr:SigE family RNA polymerase sigma factor [Mycobacteriales bacterium]